MQCTKEADVGLEAFVMRHWPLHRVRTLGAYQEYATRAVCTVDTEHGKFVVKVYEDTSALGLVAPSDKDIRGGLEVFDFLRVRGIKHAPTLLRTRTGATFARAEGKTAYVLEWLAGTTPRPSPMTWTALGAVAAELRTVTDFPHPYPIPVTGVLAELRTQANAYSFEREWLSVLAGLEARLPPAFEHAPLALIHGEINTANALQGADGVTYLLDWDAVGSGPAALMAAYPLVVCFVDEHNLTFHHDWARAFYAAYFHGAAVPNGEDQTPLFDAAILHAMRYVPFHNSAGRWARIRFALENKDRLLSAVTAPPV